MPQKSKLNAEEKVEIIRKYQQGEISLAQAAREASVETATIYRWSARYEAEGAGGFLSYQKNRVYPSELKLKAVQEYLSGSGSLREISKKYKLRNERQLSNWIKVYNAHGDFNSVKFSGGGSYMKQGRDTTQEERVQIVKDCMASGKNYGEMALKYKVSYQQVRTWTLRFEEMGEAGLEDRRGKRKKDQKPRTELEKAQIEIEQLKHRLYLAEMERDLLKKIGRDREERCLSEVRQRRIYAAIREAHEETGYPIELACKLLHAARSAYHKWASGKLSQRAAENERLAEKLEKLHAESPYKGYRRLNDDLRHDCGIHVNDKRMLRICRVKDIRSTIKYSNRGCTRHAKNPQYLAENLLDRRFYAAKPNEKWLTDVTEFK